MVGKEYLQGLRCWHREGVTEYLDIQIGELYDDYPSSDSAYPLLFGRRGVYVVAYMIRNSCGILSIPHEGFSLSLPSNHSVSPKTSVHGSFLLYE